MAVEGTSPGAEANASMILQFGHLFKDVGWETGVETLGIHKHPYWEARWNIFLLVHLSENNK